MMYPRINFDDRFKTLVDEVRSVRKSLRDSLSARDGVCVNTELAYIVDEAVYKYDYADRTLPLLYSPVSYTEAVAVINKAVESGYFEKSVSDS